MPASHPRSLPFERVHQRAEIGAAQAGSRRIVHQNPILGAPHARKKRQAVHHRVLALGAADRGQQLGRIGDFAAMLGQVLIVGGEHHHDGLRCEVRASSARSDHSSTLPPRSVVYCLGMPAGAAARSARRGLPPERWPRGGALPARSLRASGDGRGAARREPA